MYRRSSPPEPHVRTEVVADDLQHLEVVKCILRQLNDPGASAAELATLICGLPVLVARLRVCFTSAFGTRDSTLRSELAFLGNRDLEAVLLQLLEDLTDLRAERDGVPAHGSVFPRLTSVIPPARR